MYRRKSKYEDLSCSYPPVLWDLLRQRKIEASASTGVTVGVGSSKCLPNIASEVHNKVLTSAQGNLSCMQLWGHWAYYLTDVGLKRLPLLCARRHCRNTECLVGWSRSEVNGFWFCLTESVTHTLGRGGGGGGWGGRPCSAKFFSFHTCFPQSLSALILALQNNGRKNVYEAVRRLLQHPRLLSHKWNVQMCHSLESSFLFKYRFPHVAWTCNFTLSCNSVIATT